MTDSLSDFFTRLRNASRVGHTQVLIPLTKINQNCAKVLFQQGFILDYQNLGATLKITLKYKNHRPIITQLQRLSRPGCRFYVHSSQISQILRRSGSPGSPIILLSTSQGLLSDREARYLKIGGEVLGIVS